MKLFEAVIENNQKEVLKILKSMQNSSDKQIIGEMDAVYGRTALHWAAYYGYVHFIDLLIMHGSNVNEIDNRGQTSAFIAAENGHAQIITILKTRRANLDRPNVDGLTPLYIAAANGSSSSILALHAASASINFAMADSSTPLHITAKNGYSATISALKQVGANLDAQMKDGRTAVYLAAEMGNAATIRILKCEGANMDIPDHEGKTPLYVAALHGHLSAIIVLLEAGANAITSSPWDALTYAKKSIGPQHQEIAKLLKAHITQYPNGNRSLGVQNVGLFFQPINLPEQRISSLNITLSPPMSFFAIHSKQDTLLSLIQAIQKNRTMEVLGILKTGIASFGKEFINEVDKRFKGSSLYWAAYYSRNQFVTLLIEYGADINQEAGDGNTPIFIAAQNGHAQIITILSTNGANVNQPNKRGLTPLCIAAYNGNADSVTALLGAGANANIATPLTALEYARKGKYPEHKKIIILLRAHLKQYPNGIKQPANNLITELSESKEADNKDVQRKICVIS